VQYSSREPSMQKHADPSSRLSDSTFTINRFVIRVPPFWFLKPVVWFAQLKGQFGLSDSTQDTAQFYYVISQLDNKHAAEVEDVITNNNYNKYILQ
jgi:hypothetical protein